MAEFFDPGQSGATLRGPGLTALRERVAEGGVDLILVQDRDRFARELAYLYLLDREFGEHGCKLKALNDRGGDTPEGQLTDAIIAQIAKYERAKFAERAQRGRLQRAGEGKLIGSGSPPFGFRYNADRTNYVVEPVDMAVVRRLFAMVADGYTLHSIKKIFEREGIRSPGGGDYWYVPSMRRTILNDVYLTRTQEEIRTLVSPQVAAALDPEASYGVWWYAKNRVELTPDGERKRRWTPNPKEQHIAVPVPDCGIPPETLKTARQLIQAKYRPRPASKHYFELAGLVYCDACGGRMTHYSTGDNYRYYVCLRQRKHGKAACPGGAAVRAEERLEEEVWGYVDEVLATPQRVTGYVDDAIAMNRPRSTTRTRQ